MKKILSLAIVALVIFTFVGCGEKVPAIPDVAVRDIVSSIEAEVEVVKGLSELDLKSEELSDFEKTTLENFGINPEDVEEGIIKYPMINLSVDEVIVLKAVDETKVEALKKIISNHAVKQYENYENYLPAQAELIKNHTLISKGDYILYVVSSEAEKIEATFENAFTTEK